MKSVYAQIRITGETNVFLQHVKTQLWLSYQTSEVTKKGLGKVRSGRWFKKASKWNNLGHKLYDLA